MVAAAEKEKTRVIVYLDPEDARYLRRERADTRRSVTAIVAEIVREYIAGRAEPQPD